MTVTLLGSAATLDRQSARRTDPGYLEGLAARPDARFLLFDGATPIVRSCTASVWFSATDLAASHIDRCPLLFLGVEPATGAGRFGMDIGPNGAAKLARTHPLEPTGDFRALASSGALPAGDVALAGLARSLFAWHESARHCGWCGAPTAMIEGGWKRHCAPCAKDAFPRLDPVVIMLVTDGERCVLAHEPRYPERMYSTIAGYIEPGEDIAHAVRRETAEELGLTVADVIYRASQPWPFPYTLMIGCVARVDYAALIIDRTEIAEAAWFTRNEAAQMLARTHPGGLWVPGPQAIAHHLVRAFADGV